MSLSVFIDTNIFLNAILDRDNGISKDILYYLKLKDIDIILNDISVINIHYFLSRNKLPKIEIENYIRKIIKSSIIVPATKDILNNAIDSEFNDFEDAVQYFCAKKYNAKLIISDDKKGFLLSDIKVTTSYDFYKKFILKEL